MRRSTASRSAFAPKKSAGRTRMPHCSGAERPTLRGLGVPIEHPPRLNTHYRIYHFFFRDPDGHRIEIQQFEDPAWRSGIPGRD